MKIVVLNCITSNDRYNYITNHLNDFFGKNSYELYRYSKLKINTIIGDRLNELHTRYYDKIKEKKEDVYGNVFSCMYNWLNIISNAYNEGCDSILCLEDDIKMNCDLYEFEYYMNNIPVDANIISFGFKFRKFNNACKEHYGLNKNNLYIETNSNYKLAGTYAFYLDRKGMEYYIEYITSKICCADLIFNDLSNNLQKEMNVKHYIPNKNIIITNDDLMSDII